MSGYQSDCAACRTSRKRAGYQDPIGCSGHRTAAWERAWGSFLRSLRTWQDRKSRGSWLAVLRFHGRMHELDPIASSGGFCPGCQWAGVTR